MVEIMDIPNIKDRNGFWEAYPGTTALAVDECSSFWPGCHPLGAHCLRCHVLDRGAPPRCAEENRVRPDRSPFYVNWARDFANFLPEIPLKEGWSEKIVPHFFTASEMGEGDFFNFLCLP